MSCSTCCRRKRDITWGGPLQLFRGWRESSCVLQDGHGGGADGSPSLPRAGAVTTHSERGMSTGTPGNERARLTGGWALTASCKMRQPPCLGRPRAQPGPTHRGLGRVQSVWDKGGLRPTEGSARGLDTTPHSVFTCTHRAPTRPRPP